MMEHLSEPALRAAIDGALTPGSGEADHLARCRACRALVAMARSGVLDGAHATRSVIAADAAPPTPAAPVELTRGEAVGRYLIVDRIGSGAMGVVYAAYDTELDRRIAIKLVRPATGVGSLAEAQAMARLAHPNVTRVYDVGERAGAVFIAMELVDGATLDAWLAARRRPAREVLAVFLAAGEGLAAAHDAGIVHRDIKPANVLVRQDGHVFVTDFGLALAASSPLAGPGVIAGTPAYMAPEVLAGEGASVASDVYGFGVSLYEGLVGALPFKGRTLADLRAELARGELAPTGSLPRWLRRELSRALALDPAARHPSMRAFVDALARGARRRWRWAALAAAGALAVGLVVALAWPSQPTHDPCVAAGAEADVVWSPEVSARVRASFTGTGRPSADAAFALVSRGLDGWKATYRSMERDRCLATLGRTQPEPLLARRAACLQRRRLEAGALVELLATADARAVERARDAVEVLDAIEACGDFTALAQDVPLPTPTQVPAVARAREDLARAVALGAAGQGKAGLEAATRALEVARGAAHAPTVAEGWFEIGRASTSAGEHDQAMAAQRSALEGALAVRDDQLAVKAALQLAHVLGNNLGRFADARAALGLAEALVTRMGGDASLEATLHNTRGAVLYKEGALRDAVAEYRRAITLRRRAGTARWIPTPAAATAAEAVIRNNLANALAALGALDEALAEHRATLEIRLATEGASHPSVATSYNNIGYVHMERFRYREALSWFERSLALRVTLLGPEHFLVGVSEANVGMALAGLGEGAAALERLTHGLALMERKLGPAHRDVAAVVTEIAAVHLALGALDEARATLEVAFAALDASGGRDHATAARTHEVHGDLLLAEGDAAGALVAFETALAITAQARPGSPALVAPLVGVGEATVALGDLDLAVAPLEEGLARATWADRTVEGDGAFALARALTDLDGDADRVAALVAHARHAYREAGPIAAARAAALERWTTGSD